MVIIKNAFSNIKLIKITYKPLFLNDKQLYIIDSVLIYSLDKILLFKLY